MIPITPQQYAESKVKAAGYIRCETFAISFCTAGHIHCSCVTIFPFQSGVMKKITAFICGCLLVSALNITQAQTTTIILLRHAEKDTSAGSTAMKADPPLSKTGEIRAVNLPEVLKAYTPDIIYATNYIRTKASVTPLAQKFNKEIQLYDPRNLPALEEQIRQMKGKTIIVAGHSNTTPALVNLLIKENRYANLDESVYTKLWIVTLTDGKAEVKEITY